jgi:hypothetical protein
VKSWAKLQIAKGTVSDNLAYLRKQAQQELHNHIHEVIPYEYRKAMMGLKLNLKQTLEIAESAADPRTKVEARRIANDCYRYIMDLVTNGVVVTDAIKYVNGKMEHLNNQEKKILQDIKDKESAEIVPHQEEESGMGTDTDTEGKTTNGVF